MKKYLVPFGAAILVMAWLSLSMAQAPAPAAAPAPAPTDRQTMGVARTSPMGSPSEVGRPMQFQSFGHIEFQTVWERKPDFNTGMPWSQDAITRNSGRNISWRQIAERFRFYLQYGDSKTVRAVLGFEADSRDWGELGGGGTNGNGVANPQYASTGSTAYQAGSNHMGVYQTDQVQLEVKHAFVDFVVPNTPLSVSVGLQFFDVAGRMWMNNDAPGIVATANFAPHRIRALWWRQNDNNRFTYGVNDTYVATWDMTKQLFGIGAWGAYKNDLYTGQIGATTFPSITVTTPTGTSVGVEAIVLTPPTNKFDDHPYWVGVSAGFRPGNFDLSTQLIYNGGKRQFTQTTVSGNAAFAPIQGDSKYNAYAGEARAAYRLGPGLFAGLEGFYASGNNADKADQIRQYEIPTSSEATSNFGNDRTVFMWMNAAQMGYYHMRNSPFTGFWYGRANIEFSPLVWLRMNLNYLYIGDTTSGSPGTGISATTRLASTKILNSPVGSRTDKDMSFVGHELNVINTLTIYKNFQWNIGVYGFWPGPMFDRVNSSGQVIQGAEFSYGVNTKMVYAF